MDRKLIFDLGLHKGGDAEYYLAKGFRVVGLEANPSLCASVRNNYENAIRERRLVVVERALAETSAGAVSFFINENHDDWGSLNRSACEQGLGEATEIRVQSITLHELVKEYGAPYTSNAISRAATPFSPPSLRKLRRSRPSSRSRRPRRTTSRCCSAADTTGSNLSTSGCIRSPARQIPPARAFLSMHGLIPIAADFSGWIWSGRSGPTSQR